MPEETSTTTPELIPETTVAPESDRRDDSVDLEPETAAELEGGDVPLHARRRMLLWQIIHEEKARGASSPKS
jgi:hypothetical protein